MIQENQTTEPPVARLSTGYDAWHQRIFESAPDHPDEESPWYRLVLEHLVPVNGKRVLEVACGRGGFARLLASNGARVFGADFSAAALRIAQQKSAQDGNATHGIALAQADAQTLPYADESFDVVISCETIEHLLDPLAALKEMARVTRAAGVLYLTTPNYFNAMGLYQIYGLVRRRNLSPGGDQPFDRVFLFPQIRRLLRRAGWSITRSDGTVHQFPIWPRHNPVIVPALESVRGIRKLLAPLAFHYFLMGRKRTAHS